MKSEAEIRTMLERLLKQLAESEKNHVETFQDRHNVRYFEAFEKRNKQIENEINWIGEMAVLEWVLEEKQGWLPTWMREVKS